MRRAMTLRMLVCGSRLSPGATKTGWPPAGGAGAFAAAFPFEIASIPLGTLIASIALLLFVFTTLLTWSYYGERAITFLYDRIKGSTREGEKKLHMVWRVLWCVVIFIGAAQPSELVWRLGDISNATSTTVCVDCIAGKASQAGAASPRAGRPPARPVSTLSRRADRVAGSSGRALTVRVSVLG